LLKSWWWRETAGLTQNEKFYSVTDTQAAALEFLKSVAEKLLVW
jgi:hypothetical protein